MSRTLVRKHPKTGWGSSFGTQGTDRNRKSSQRMSTCAQEKRILDEDDTTRRTEEDGRNQLQFRNLEYGGRWLCSVM